MPKKPIKHCVAIFIGDTSPAGVKKSLGGLPTVKIFFDGEMASGKTKLSNVCFNTIAQFLEKSVFEGGFARQARVAIFDDIHTSMLKKLMEM